MYLVMPTYSGTQRAAEDGKSKYLGFKPCLDLLGVKMNLATPLVAAGIVS